jgi:hypothetical protein
VTHFNASDGQHFLHHPEAQGKVKVQPYVTANDFSREPMASIAGVTDRFHPPLFAR